MTTHVTPDQTLSFQQKAAKHWTSDRLKKLTAGHKFVITPENAPALLRTLGVLNADASISVDATRKLVQVNHLFSQVRPYFEDLISRHPKINILDAGCGSSVLTFTLAWAFNSYWNHQTKIVGIDTSAKLIEKNTQNAVLHSYHSFLQFSVSEISKYEWPTDDAEKPTRPHAVVALHACDTATDDALALAIKQKSDFIAVAPCCHAELAKNWKTNADKAHPLSPAFHNPHLRRELATHFTDLMRVLILRGHGYEVTTTEFTMSHATPKNTLILATRRGNYHKESQSELKALIDWCGGETISLVEKARF